MKPFLFIGLIGLVVLVYLILIKSQNLNYVVPVNSKGEAVSSAQQKKFSEPIQIESIRNKSYLGSEIKIEQTLEPGSNYKRYLASYQSEGLKIFGLLTIPNEEPPKGGFPAIIFNHGYIPPDQYQTTERYVAYVDSFSRNGFVVFKSDYRGHGNSEGEPLGEYYSEAYTTDVLNALSSVKKLKEVNPGRIGMWGHSMGGHIALRSMVVFPKEIKAFVIWGGVVGTYDDLLNNWRRRVPFQPSSREISLRNRFRTELLAKYGTPQTNPEFWKSVDPYSFLSDVQAPVQLHAGEEDEEVPVLFSEHLKTELEKNGKKVELYVYPGGDHNISSPNFEEAIQRSIDFFKKYL